MNNSKIIVVASNMTSSKTLRTILQKFLHPHNNHKADFTQKLLVYILCQFNQYQTENIGRTLLSYSLILRVTTIIRLLFCNLNVEAVDLQTSTIIQFLPHPQQNENHQPCISTCFRWKKKETCFLFPNSVCDKLQIYLLQMSRCSIYLHQLDI